MDLDHLAKVFLPCQRPSPTGRDHRIEKEVGATCLSLATRFRWAEGDRPTISENVRLNVQRLLKPTAMQISVTVMSWWRSRNLARSAHNDATAAQVRDLVRKGAGGGWLAFTTDDVQGTFERIESAGAEITQEPIEKPYGTDFAIRDPFGNNIRIGSITQ